jgi:hypothetical protein
MFTGSAPYTEMFRGTLHPGFIVHLLGSLLAALRPQRAINGLKGKEA